MAEGSRMWPISLLTMMFLLPLLSAAPLDIAGDIKKEDVKDDNGGMHSHDENVTRGGKFFGHNQFDMGDMNISGSVAGDVVSIGHEVNIDVHGHTHDHHHHEADSAVDGGWSNWSEYGQCSKSCGGGQQTRTRTCTNPVPQHNGRTCEEQNIGDPTQTKDCNLHECAVDGGWSNWSEYGQCSKSCGGGQQTRTRTCTNPVPQHNGRTCEQQNIGDPTQTKGCDACPAVWSPVCGVDGKTYSNTCKACGIEVACDGLCPCNEKFPCEFDDGLLTPQVLEGGQLSPYDTSQLFKWENNVIPYYYTNQKTTDGDKALVRDVMDTFEDLTCFTFIEEDEDVNGNKHQVGIDIKDSSCRGGISGYVMPAPYREQKLLLKLTAHVTNEDGKDECGTRGLIIHELMHVLGVGHTQRRNDRDNFIRVNFGNLDGEKTFIKDQYKKCQDCKLFDRIPYNCGSIMHYGTHFKGKEIIEPKDKETCTLGESPLLYRVWTAPPKDWELLNIIGNCKEPTSAQLAPANINYAIEMPNIGKLFQGYDIMKANPLPVDPFPVDPGFRLPIFEATYSGSMTPDRRYRQPDGTSISSCIGSCSVSFKSKEIAGSKKYQESLAMKVGLSVGGSTGVWGGKFSASYGYKQVAEKTSFGSNLFTQSSASCCAYSAEMLSFKLPSLSQNFRDGVDILTEKYDERIYLKFIEEFGTHFIRKALMGALYGEQTEISKESWTTLQENGVDIAAAAELSSEYAVKGSVSFESSEDKKMAAAFSKKSKSRLEFTIGVKPPADGKQGTWLQKTISEPAPMELTLGGSILDLLEHDDIKAEVSTAVKANLKRALDGYCNHLLISGEAKTCSSPGPDPALPAPKPTVESSKDYGHAWRGSLLLENFCEGKNPSNYWLTPDGKTGEEAYIILNLGKVIKFNTFKIKNTHNGHSNDRGAKNVALYTSYSKNGPWQLKAEKQITDARNKVCDDVPLEEVTIATTNAQFIKLVINSYYGYGGGLKYLGVDFVPDPKPTVESSNDYNHDYRGSLLLKNACDGSPPNYWLTPDRKVGQEAYIILNLWKVTQFNRFKIKNTHNGNSNDRGAKSVALYTSNSKNGPWKLKATKRIADARNKGCKVPLEVVTIATTNAQFIKLVINSYYGYGGGLQYLGVDLVVPGYVSLGCWKDTSNRAIARLADGGLWNFASEWQNPVELCFAVAKSKGYPAFAVQNDGQCFASSTALKTYKKYGAASNCANGKGGRWSNDVYKIAG